jgi:hypothetical protein
MCRNIMLKTYRQPHYIGIKIYVLRKNNPLAPSSMNMYVCMCVCVSHLSKQQKEMNVALVLLACWMEYLLINC